MGGDGGVKATDRKFIRGTKDASEKVPLFHLFHLIHLFHLMQ